MENKIISIDVIQDIYNDDGEVIGKLVADKSGEQWKIKNPRGALKDRWPQLEAGLAIELSFGTYKDSPFVNDFTVVKDAFVKQAIETVKDDKGSDIQQQVAIKEIGECWRAGKLQNNDPEVIAYKAWIIDKLDGYYKKEVTHETASPESDNKANPTKEVSKLQDKPESTEGIGEDAVDMADLSQRVNNFTPEQRKDLGNFVKLSFGVSATGKLSQVMGRLTMNQQFQVMDKINEMTKEQ